MNRIIHSENLIALSTFELESVDLIYIDPPFNTGRRQIRNRPTFHTTHGFDDSFNNYVEFLQPRLEQAYRVLTSTGSFFLHIDYRESHYCKVLLDLIFGRDCFQNEIIWAYDYGARSKKKWSAKHDTIFWYTKDPNEYTFNFDEMDRIPYMAPGLVGPEKAARGKTPTDVWWHTIVSPNGREKTGYATQKPLGVLRRIIKVHSNPGDTVLDFFAGSGTTGHAAAENGRNFILVDESADAISVMESRLAEFKPEVLKGAA